ncbi:hypothetical protein DV515_00003756 [Chloebia gouldiae]|uniref:Uncharacterized protein n=1 Tax=Chloebia gouldiae TaxID=44316 RepID=A0A3L8SSN5_CHLGU|nr:hypothetical protein DV515_00003756 [Chloebia gouldiae]
MFGIYNAGGGSQPFKEFQLGAGEAVPSRLPGTYQGDMYLSKRALVSESQPGTLLSSQGEWGSPENNVKKKDMSHTFLKGEKKSIPLPLGLAGV